MPATRAPILLGLALILPLATFAGCAAARCEADRDRSVERCIADYAHARTIVVPKRDAIDSQELILLGIWPATGAQTAAPSSQPATPSDSSAPRIPANYWRPNVGRQMGGELKEFARRDGLRGFKTAFCNVENAVALVGTLGASIAIREGGVDDAVRRRTVGEFKLDQLDEPIAILGDPSTHFAGAGVLWLSSALAQDFREHEVARKLGEALIVNGVTTMGLKLTVMTRGPDDDTRAWPSGHTSSAFTTAAVLNEYYGPAVGVPSLALAGLVGYQRIDARVHDLSDVVFGAMLGYVVGSSIARDGKAEFPELLGFKVLPYASTNSNAGGVIFTRSW